MSQGFPALGKQLKIVNKLNNMAITISQGWHNIKPGFAIMQRPDFPHIQTLKITQKGDSQVYFIETPQSDLVLSPRSAWGDMVYSEVKFDKNKKQTSQLWRIIPYNGVMYNEKDKKNLPFEYVPVATSQGGCKCGTSEPKTQNQPFIKLGYEFESGNHLNYHYEDHKYREHVIRSSMDQNQKKTGNIEGIYGENDIPVPVRFPVKQKNNLHPIDRDNKGWFFIENVKFNLVLEIQGGIDEIGMNVVLNKLYGHRNQLWKFV